jgi:hypothetical protein
VTLDTPNGSVRARAKFNASLEPGVVFGEHGWWEACDELELPGYPPYGPDSANLNLVLRQTPSDPISGSSPLRASVCNVALLTAPEPVTQSRLRSRLDPEGMALRHGCGRPPTT